MLKRISTFNTSWTWSKSTMDGPVATINVSSAGVHTVNVWMREDGFVLDKLVLTVSGSYTPTGVGPAESPRGNSLVFTPNVLTFTVEEDGSAPPQYTVLSTSDLGNASYTITVASDVSDWLLVTPTSGDTDTQDTLTVSIDAAGLSPGTYTGTITAANGSYTDGTVDVTLIVTGTGIYDLLLSSSPNRSNPVPLEGETVSGAIYVFTGPDAGVSRVSFYLDDPGMIGSPIRVENYVPYDFAGPAGGSNASPYDTRLLLDGPHEITALIDLDGGGSELNSSTFTVANNAPANDPYQQNPGTDGIVSIEVEHFDANVSQGGHDWVQIFPSGYSGSGAMQALPNIETNNNTGYVTNSPQLDFVVNFVKTGTHYVWIRGIGANGYDDSVHVGLDGAESATSDRISKFNTSWRWSHDTMDGVVARVNVATTGLHTVNVWMREDGFVLDKLVLTVSGSYTPTGEGPAESPRAN